MFLRSIRFQIVLWQMFILSMALLTFGLILYHNFGHKLSRDTDDLLRSRAKGIVDSIDTYWETERLEANQDASKEHFTKQGNINFMKIAQRWVGEKNTDPSLINLIVRIFDAQGFLIASSRNMPAGSLNSRILGNIQSNRNHIEDATIEINASKPALFRSLTVPVMENGKLAYIVQVASPLGALHAARKNLSLLLLILLPSTVLLTGITGSFLAKLTLKPVNQMIDTIHQITAENLKLRISIPNTKDEIESLAKTFNDMIERLDESFSSQRQFMQDISHELKTPLSILKGELEVALNRIRSAEEYTNVLHSSLEEINRLTRIVENLLMLARFDAKTIIMETGAMDLSVLIKDSLEDIHVLADQKHIKLQFEPTDATIIQADKGQIKRLILNLLDNAIKYTPPKGCISINVSQQKGMAEITIADTGIGIPQESLPHIFNRFYRVDQSRSDSGFGLGLSIAQSIAQAHHGQIHVKANSPQGTVFVVSLPFNQL